MQAGQVVECGAGRGEHVAAVVAKDVLRELEMAPRGRHELPHARGPCTRHGLRVERAFDEGQQRQFAGQAALLHLFDDVVQVTPAALGHALHVLGLARVVVLALAHELVVEVGNAEAVAHALPEIDLRRAVVQIDGHLGAPGIDGRFGALLARRDGNGRHGRRGRGCGHRLPMQRQRPRAPRPLRALAQPR